jgi:hypothetical protein
VTLPRLLSDLEALRAAAIPGPWEVGPQDPDNPHLGYSVNSPLHPADHHAADGPTPDDTCVGFIPLMQDCGDYLHRQVESSYRLVVAMHTNLPAMLRALRAVYAWQASVDAEPEDYPWPISTETARAWEAMDAALAALGEAKEAGR